MSATYCTVLVTVLQGKYFHAHRSKKLYVTCRFNNEILTSDPVDHHQQPIWDTEFSWALAPKTLSFLRSQRASLKLICYAIEGSVREVVGYIMLDLRSSGMNKFFPLLNTKNTSMRPEIKLHFSVTNQRDMLLMSPTHDTAKSIY